MKDRILYYLHEFATGNPNDLAAEIKQELGLDDNTFQERAHNVRSQILHSYSQFSISTIDAFFQKVIRAFTRESGLMGDYRLEVDQDLVLEEVVDNLIDELGSNRELTEWVVEFAKENLENERAWDIRHSLIDFSKEIFREEFKAIEDEVISSTSQLDFFKSLQRRLIATKNDFLKSMREPAREALNIIQSNGWTQDDFTGKSNSGLFTFLRENANAKKVSETHAGGKNVRTNFVHPEGWAHKQSRNTVAIFQAARTRLAPLVADLIETYDARITQALSADVALNHLYVFGLIADISRKLKEYKDENNLMLLADAPKFLNGIIADSDTPFVYEKVGSFYRNYLIDEFQDTSGMQWKNFQPLITNSLDQGHHCLVVGDVKQAIYRWRGGDLNLLQTQIPQYIGEQRTLVQHLDRNFRSAQNVVRFNNAFFKAASALVSSTNNTNMPTEVFADVAQNVFSKDDGFVEVSFISNDAEDGEDETNLLKRGWKEKALEAIPRHLERLQQSGIALRDIAFLVRRNDEGQQIANYLLQYKSSPQAQAGCMYDVVSNESLRIDSASTVNLVLGAMQYLLNPDNAIARAQLVFEYSRIHQPEKNLSDVFEVTNQNVFENNLPSQFTNQKSSLRKLSIVELTERIIEIFSLGAVTGEFVYLQAFQDLVIEFANREKNDLGAFLEWWEQMRRKKSVQLSGEVNAAQIITIHKSKGLQFKYVILPYCSWALDHDNWQSPTLWVKSDRSPFENAGYVPLKYSSSLADTFFKSAYEDEKNKTYLDNLNLLYVALTRAENGMIVMSPSPETKAYRSTVAELVYNSVGALTEFQQNWNAAEGLFSLGVIGGTGEINKETTAPGYEMKKYLSHTWQDTLVILKKGQQTFTKEDGEKLARINHGVVVHDVLSRMMLADDLDAAIELSTLQGIIKQSDAPEIREKISSLLGLPQVREWFSEGWEVKTEVPIVLPGGEEARIDRLLVKDKKAIVIDFKTGSRTRSDTDQVLKYQDILRQMNFTSVEGYLLYLAERAVVEVRAGGKQKLVKKVVAKDQLNLGF